MSSNQFVELLKSLLATRVQDKVSTAVLEWIVKRHDIIEVSRAFCRCHCQSATLRRPEKQFSHHRPDCLRKFDVRLFAVVVERRNVTDPRDGVDLIR